MRKIIVIQHCQSEHHINNMTGGWTEINMRYVYLEIERHKIDWK
jgi:hypothetical protein